MHCVNATYIYKNGCEIIRIHGIFIIQIIVLYPSVFNTWEEIPDDGLQTPTHVEVETDNLFYTCCILHVLSFEMKVYRYQYKCRIMFLWLVTKCATLMLVVVSLGRQTVRCL